MEKYPNLGDIAAVKQNWTKYSRHFYTFKNVDHNHTWDLSPTLKNLFSSFWVHRSSGIQASHFTQ